MIRRMAKPVVAMVLCTLPVSAQVGIWNNHTSLQEIRGIARSGDTFWAATSGGLFAWKEGSTTFRKLTNADGLRSTDLTAVAVDNNGDVWTGTSSGVIHVYSPGKNSWRYIPDIAAVNQTNKRINSLSVYGDTLLICSGFGVSLFRVNQFQFGDTYTRFGSLSSTARVSVNSALLFNGNFWITLTDGQNVHRTAYASLSSPNLLQPNEWTLQIVGNSTNIPNLLAPYGGSLYVSSTAGVFLLAGGQWSVVDSLAGREFVALTSSPEKLVAVDVNRTVYQLTGQNSVSRVGTTLPQVATSVRIGPTGTAIVGSRAGGLMTFNGTSWISFFPNGPGSNQFTSVAVDAAGNVWGGSGNANGKGFYRLKENFWTTFNTGNSPLPGNDFYRVSPGCNSDMWVSSWGGGLVLMPAGTDSVNRNLVFNTNVGMVGIPGNTAYVVCSNVVCDRKGNTWVAIQFPDNKRALAVRTASGEWRTYPVYISGVPASYLTNIQVSRSLAIDASDNLWMAAVTEGRKGAITINNRGAVGDTIAETVVSSANGLPDDNVRCIVVDKENDIWVGTDRGIGIILDPANPTRSGGVASYKPLLGTLINAIAVDPLNQKWVATNEGVVVLSRDGTQTLAQYTVANTGGRLIDNDVKDIAIDPATGTVYFATLNGLASLTTTSVEPGKDFDKISVSPNPFRLPASVPLTVDGLVSNSRLKILTVDGRLVRELTTPGGRIGFWDGRDEQGEFVSSGIYLIVAYSETEKGKVATGKVAIIRR